MGVEFIKWPDAEERRRISATVERATGFPGVVGMIDGTHVYITAPLADPLQYINRHHSYSINVQCVVDCNLLVRHLHVGEPGSMNDRRVFRRSPLCRDLLTNHGGEFISAEEHLLGDEAYAQTDYMMTPFENNGHLTEVQIKYNKKLSQGRVRVENAFALSKGKWRRLKFMQARKQERVVDHVTASFVLHNFIILNGETLFDEEELGRPIAAVEVMRNRIVEDVEDQDEEENEIERRLSDLQAAAIARGLEKRLVFMNYVVPQN